MFHSIVVIVVLAASAAVHATPATLFSRSQCDTGSVSCCNSVQPAGSDAANDALSGLLNIPVGLGVPIGLDCTPINVIGEGSGANCNASPVCCENNYNGGLIGISCVPILLQG
ncbi:hypothetical protein NM688_g261 [Phlebia brevispora]|uniref:Uncharacterized protein n=1 Tax=Phlebia brevispora TaxID=194682 RepID=A0ACC1TEW2_9APHY|nr:hypothetical protein NM688_g261 [Phlebia brevispora]